MPEVDVEDTLPGDHVHDEAKVEHGAAARCKVCPVVRLVGEGDDVELLLAGTASREDGEQHGPCDEAADDAADDGDLEEAQEEV